MKTDKISFGTKPHIDYIAAKAALPKYQQNLTEGIINAFKNLAKNKNNNNLYLNIGIKQDLKNLETDTLELSYWIKDEKSPIGISLQSTINLNPNRLEGLSPRKIKNILLKADEKLKNSNKKTDLITGYQSYKKKEHPQKHIQRINYLTDKFGCFFDL